MRGLLAAAGVTDRGRDVVPLLAARGHDVDARADRVAIAARALQAQAEPVIAGAGGIPENRRRAPDRCHHHVHTAVAIEIGESGAAVLRGRADFHGRILARRRD